MKKTNENGITLVALVITVIIMLILASVGINTGKGTIEYAKFNKIKSELTILQTKVNELNEKGNTDIGQKISNTQKEILNNEIVSGIIYKDKTEEEKKTIESGFRFISSNEIKSKLGLDGFDRSYLINVEYRYVVSCEGFTYKGITYYMIDQIDDGMYNVGYHNKNSNNGSFELSTKVVGDEYRIVVSDIKHDGYVSNWQVKYKLNTEENWQTSNQLEFAVEKAGTYIVNVVHGDEIDLGKMNIDVSPKYATSNLILNYDAINNISENEHSSTTTIWKDLSGNKNDAQITGATWGENYLSFDGIDDFAKTTSNVNYKDSCAVTVQFVLKGGLAQNTLQMIVESSENWNKNQASYGIDFNEFGTNNINTTFHLNGYEYNIKRTDDNILSNTDINIFTVVINNYNEWNSFMKVYKNGELITLKELTGYDKDISNIKFKDYIMYIAAGGENNYFAKMKLGALRIYNRELTKDEVTDSYTLDNQRFK